MAEEKAEKPSPIMEFRKKLMNHANLKEEVLNGLKSTNARVRSLATKVAFKTQDHEFVKKHVLPLINSDKSKKVLRTLSEKITRKDLLKKVTALKVKKAAKAEKPAAEAAPTAAKAEG